MKQTIFLLGALAALLIGCGGNVIAGGSGGGNTSTVTVPAEYASCDGPGQCVLLPSTCCGTCAFPEVSDYVAVNSAQASAYQIETCPEPVGCPDCVGPTNPNLFAYCDLGQCVVGDVRNHVVSVCQDDSECQIRAGSECCQPCGTVSFDQLTSVSSSAVTTLEELVCAPGTGCPKCATGYPQAIGVCGEDAHCAVAPGGG